MKTDLVDIHCHLDFKDFDGDQEDVIKNALNESIRMITIGADRESSQKAVEIAEHYNGVYASIGAHPDDIEKNFDEDFYRQLAKKPKVVAIGECGLDYHEIRKLLPCQEVSRIRKQKELFCRQIELAVELDRPLMIHCRDSHEDVLDILNGYSYKHKLKGDIHFFTGSWEEARKYMDMGFSFSFTGVITFAGEYDEVIKKLPLDRIMVETDAPFVAPVPYRGKRCEPLYVKEVAKRIAEIKNISYEEVCEATTRNAVKLFGLK